MANDVPQQAVSPATGEIYESYLKQREKEKRQADAKRLMDEQSSHMAYIREAPVREDAGTITASDPRRGMPVSPITTAVLEIPRDIRKGEYVNAFNKVVDAATEIGQGAHVSKPGAVLRASSPGLSPKVGERMIVKQQKIVEQWLKKGAITEKDVSDGTVQSAIYQAANHKIDPLSTTPKEILSRFPDRVPPDRVPEFHKVNEPFGKGITVYDVDDSPEGQTATRRVVSGQLGTKAQPWCLIETDADGNLTDSAKILWKEYNAVPKQIAYDRDGNIIAFRATPPRHRSMLSRIGGPSGSWWTLSDNQHFDTRGDNFADADHAVPYRTRDPGDPSRYMVGLVGSKEHPITYVSHMERVALPYDTAMLMGYEQGQMRGHTPYKRWDKFGNLSYERTVDGDTLHSTIYSSMLDEHGTPKVIKKFSLRKATPEELEKMRDFSKRMSEKGSKLSYMDRPYFGNAGEQDMSNAYEIFGTGGDNYVNTGKKIVYDNPNGLPDVSVYDQRGEPVTDREAPESEVRQAAKGGETAGSAGSEDVMGRNGGSGVPAQPGGPRIVINPDVFHDKRDALAVAFNEGLRVFMETRDFEPEAEPTEEQRKFFSDTPYADDETMLRRTILARIATFDTSVKDPTADQIAETGEVLRMVLESDFTKTPEERAAVKRLFDAAQATLEKIGGRPLAPKEEEHGDKERGEEEPGVQADAKGGDVRGVMDWSDRYNTPLPDDKVEAYNAWRARLPKALQYSGNYDLQGYFLEHGAEDKKPGEHMNDKYKKPNHPSFSSESMYSGTGDVSGGVWGGDEKTGWTFTPSKYNRSLRTDQQILDYFKTGDPGVRVTFPVESAIRTASVEPEAPTADAILSAYGRRAAMKGGDTAPSAKLVTFLKKHEKYAAKAYKDVGGYAVGYGAHTVNGKAVTEGTTLSAAGADAQLARDIGVRERRLSGMLPGWGHFDRDMKDAVIQAAFGNDDMFTAEKSPNLHRKLTEAAALKDPTARIRGLADALYDELPTYTRANGEVQPGLEARQLDARDTFLAGTGRHRAAEEATKQAALDKKPLNEV